MTLASVQTGADTTAFLAYALGVLAFTAAFLGLAVLTHYISRAFERTGKEGQR